MAMKSVDESVEEFGIDREGTVFSMADIPKEDNQSLRKELSTICSGDGSVEDKI